MSNLSRSRWAIALVSACLAVGVAPVHAGVTPEIQHQIRAATFEVVMKKPDKDPLTYEKPLPLELLPYIERTDLYASVGTAFALGHNTYVTAGHVLLAAADSQYGPPALRSSDGKIYPVSQIRKFSGHEDFAVFSVAQDPDPPGLAVNRAPRIDDPVLAVGNALGEGVVIRDGLYTSDTAEEQDGRWKWIRFSAAASPGNSGGPLLDAGGKVIGIVIAKSQNENLNYALPIARILDAPEARASVDVRHSVVMPFMTGSITDTMKADFALPLDWAHFNETLSTSRNRANDASRVALLQAYQTSAFPLGRGSDAILYEDDVGGRRIGVITQDSSDEWVAAEPGFKTTDLPQDGKLEVAAVAGVSLLHVHRSSNASSADFYGDTKAFMDTALKGLNWRRRVGTADVRIVSLGSAASDVLHTDRYGRRWQSRVWPLPYRDAYAAALLLPTPDGYVGLLIDTPSMNLRQAQAYLALLADLTYANYEGSLEQWQAFLARRALLPEPLAGITLQSTPNWKLHTSRFESMVPNGLMKLDAQSELILATAFALEGKKLTWGPAGAWWYRDRREKTLLGVWRQQRPPDGVKAELRHKFDDIMAHQSPYDGRPVHDSPDSYVMYSTVEAPGSEPRLSAADLVYAVVLRIDGDPSMTQLGNFQDLAVQNTKVLERGSGTQASPKTALATPVPVAQRAAALVDAARDSDAEFGSDFRGRVFSADVAQYIGGYASTITTPGSAAGTPGKDRATAPSKLTGEDLDPQLKARTLALGAYWTVAPGVVHNRDLWVPFLQRNHLPPTLAHDEAVLAAETRLRKAFEQPPVDSTWADAAQALMDAYIAERRRLVMLVRPPPAINYTARQSPCPPPATGTSGKDTPKVGAYTRSPADFYPAVLRRQQVQGNVVVGLRISREGCPIGTAIVGSSGSELLDNAALQWIDTTPFLPAEKDGKPVEATTLVPLRFSLQ